MTSTDTHGISDAQLIEHLHARGWNVGTIDVPMIREGAAAIQADALAAIKAARVQALEPMSDEDAASLGLDAATNNTYSEGRFLTALFTRDALIGFVRAIEAHHAIRLLGEDAGRGE